MYATCIFCHGALGANGEIESFPVGKRIAFDAAKGRLWVLCPVCDRWNLSPLDERWEAVERAEALYRGTPTRVATGEIGLAKRRSGLELIRIGQPLRPEFAAWRYGRQLQSRFRRAWFERGMQAADESRVMRAVGWTLWLGAPAVLVATLPLIIARKVREGIADARRIHGIAVDGEQLAVHGWHLKSLQLRADPVDRWQLNILHTTGRAVARGNDVMPLLGRMLPHMNALGASAEQVRQAVAKIEHFREPERLLDFVSTRSSADQRLTTAVAYEQRLALEMMAHEESERRAMDGELATLEAAWREAEEIAAIADNLLLPERVRRLLQRDK